ncbi:hypothetical protein ONZ45_g19711 [Pleurotus djamor]|nr:hypothetical protein ONZ45_g19711 [Pleurotus djamor]
MFLVAPFVLLLATLVVASPAPKYPTRPVRQRAVNRLIKTLSIDEMKADLARLSSFHTRFYNSTTGAAASTWWLEYVSALTYSRDDITARAVSHEGFPQTSTIVRVEGSIYPNAPVTIVGSHIDSVTWRGEDPATDRSPGADDDGSGSINVLATLKALLKDGFKPSTPLEFHWYAGEEGGLLGSDAIAKQYKADGVQVKAYMQLDMNAYTKPGEEEAIAIRQDFSEPALNSFLETLVNTYIKLPIVRPECGYACSDHASWNRQGFPASMPFEGPNRNPLFHTIDDTTEAPGFSWEHSKQFAKLAIAYAYELTA